MKVEIAISMHDCVQVGHTHIGLSGMTDVLGGAAVVIDLHTSNLTGLSVSFHGSTEEIRALAQKLIECADITDAAQRERSPI